jgi:alkanesulfonate monooxygenase SsuD/methylene tetrahydromethanopterin reductase-like flavin-dependent oxidoreductase (luciferase family)
MILGVNLPNYSRLGNREAMIAIAERAEALGYSSLWTSDHILVPKNLPEPYGNVLELSPRSVTSRPALNTSGWALESWFYRSETRCLSRNRPPPSTISVVADSPSALVLAGWSRNTDTFEPTSAAAAD